MLYAESQLFPAELNYVQTKSSYLNAYVNIYKAMGGGWVSNAEKLAQPQPPSADSNSFAVKKD